MASDQEILAYLNRIEDAQNRQHKEMGDKITELNLSCNTLLTERKADAKKLEDHEKRLRANERVLHSVTAFFSVASVIFGAGLTWLFEKFLSGEA